MKKFTNVLSILLSLVMIISLASCKGSIANKDISTEKKITLKVWGSQEDQALLKELVEGFEKENTQKTYAITFCVVSEAEAKTKFLEDPQTAADVFSFPNDQICDFVAANALYEITGNIDGIYKANMPGSMEAATLEGKVYGYPATINNGYFLYYDKSVFSTKQVETLDGILSAANTVGKKVFMDVSNGWYISSFFFGAGCKLGIDANGKPTCNFNNATGLEVGSAIKNFTADKAFITGDDTVITGGMGTEICAAVSGAWSADKIKARLGGNYAATKLPAFTVGGVQKQMSALGSYTLIGINKNTKYPSDAMALAEWLTNEQSQTKRFAMRSLVPTNLAVAGSKALKSNAALGALAAQGEFTLPQKDIPVSYWTAAEEFGKLMEDKNYDKTIKEQLDNMVKTIKA